MPKKGSGIKKGSKLQVYNGTADKTSGGLTKTDLMKNDKGKVVSKKRHEIGKALQKKYPMKK